MMRMLIAADDKNPKKILVNALSDSGYNASGTDRGMKAVELLAEDEYVIVPADLPPDLGASRKAACIRLEDAERGHTLKARRGRPPGQGGGTPRHLSQDHLQQAAELRSAG